MLLSESDFHDPDRRDGGDILQPAACTIGTCGCKCTGALTLHCATGGSLQPWGLPKEYDIFYSCQGGEWNDFARNWTLAKASFKRLISELGIKVTSQAGQYGLAISHPLLPLTYLHSRCVEHKE